MVGALFDFWQSEVPSSEVQAELACLIEGFPDKAMDHHTRLHPLQFPLAEAKHTSVSGGNPLGLVR